MPDVDIRPSGLRDILGGFRRFMYDILGENRASRTTYLGDFVIRRTTYSGENGHSSATHLGDPHPLMHDTLGGKRTFSTTYLGENEPFSRHTWGKNSEKSRPGRKRLRRLMMIHHCFYLFIQTKGIKHQRPERVN